MTETVIYSDDNPIVGYGLGGLPSGTIIYDENTLATRNIANFTGTQYGTLDTPITFTGDFEIEIEFSKSTTTTKTLLGDNHSVSYYFDISSSFISVFASGSIHLYSHAGHTPFDGKLHKINYKLVGTNLTVSLDGTALDTKTIVPYVGANNFRIGNSNSITNSLFEGNILSTKFTDNSGASPAVIANYVFNSGSTFYQLPSGESLGDELVSAGQFIAQGGTNVSGVSDYAFTMAGDGISQNRAYTNLATVIGARYSIQITRGSVTGSAPVAYIRDSLTGTGNILNSITMASNGDYFMSFTATTTESSVLWAQSDVNSVSSYSSVFVNQLPNYTCLLTNFTSANWSRYTLQRNVVHDAGSVVEAWVGGNLVVNGGFTDWTGDDPVNWVVTTPDTVGNSVSEVSGQCNISGDGTNVNYIEQTILTTSNTYLASLDITEVNLPSGSLQQEEPTFGAVRDWNTVGHNSWLFDARQVVFRLRSARTGLPASDTTFDNVSVQHSLEVAQP